MSAGYVYMQVLMILHQGIRVVQQNDAKKRLLATNWGLFLILLQQEWMSPIYVEF